MSFAKVRNSSEGKTDFNTFAMQTETVISPFTSHFSRKRTAFTLAEVLFHPAEQSKRIAFTLAEVLITLGIIGVVAALTMPSLIQNFRKQQTVTGLKKAYTVINQAMKLSEIDNGPYDTWENGSDIGPKAYTEKYWLPYFKDAYICDTPQKCGYKSNHPYKDLDGNSAGSTLVFERYRIPFVTSDGIMYSVTVMGGQNVPLEEIYIDINASKGPNQFCSDYFTFIRTSKGIVPRGYDLSSKELEENIDVFNCAAKIMKDGWQIKDDYPIKF